MATVTLTFLGEKQIDYGITTVNTESTHIKPDTNNNEYVKNNKVRTPYRGRDAVKPQGNRK